ncbi:cytochrome bc1 complex diheme cytochrome c subunit [Pseudonocardia oceani]|uniref:Cytochrome bc1 complex cytochrome c subunit n=3 Tax=Pseudonocardia oceani TaxID=2792013 RepID=A0ABS6UGC5_9PSEU|nr:c-type cytochrome [Pseudonocardia oceani]MBW0108766.1 c-type cytochrome [Pseudonocardia oceani]MBW0122994.1 c-type cytochrome [Pseudonocardia oceani]MBW0131267.1 c-type cytochrome [Pseudonocardia oceani]
MRQRPSGRSRHRRVRDAAALLVGLLVAGALYGLLAPRPQTADARSDPALLEQGRQLYATSCITCHGQNLQGVESRALSLIGVGDAAVYFQVSSGRMPLARQQAQARRKPPLPQFDPGTAEGQENLRALGAYVQAAGGGPRVPEARGGALVGDDASRGGQLFRLNCSSCHNFTGRGGALLDGKYAPTLEEASPVQVYTAMLSGPQAMPRFSDRQLAPEEKRDIIAYVLAVRGERNNVGGFGLGEVGPTAEGLTAFLVGLAALVLVTAWIGARS